MKYDTNELRKQLQATLKGECPNVFYEKTRSPAAYPYVVYDLSEISYESGKVAYELEVNCVGKDVAAIESLSDRVQGIFDSHYYDGPKFFYHCHRGKRNAIEEEDRSLARRRLTFSLYLFSKED